MSEQRLWVILKVADGYSCALCGHEGIREGNTRSLVSLFHLHTPQGDSTHEVKTCEGCTRMIDSTTNLRDPFNLLTHPEAPF